MTRLGEELQSDSIAISRIVILLGLGFWGAVMEIIWGFDHGLLFLINGISQSTCCARMSKSATINTKPCSM